MEPIQAQDQPGQTQQHHGHPGFFSTPSLSLSCLLFLFLLQTPSGPRARDRLQEGMGNEHITKARDFTLQMRREAIPNATERQSRGIIASA